MLCYVSQAFGGHNSSIAQDVPLCPDTVNLGNMSA
jgi:hypothetical protein